MASLDENPVEDAALAPLLGGGRFGRYVVLRWLGTGSTGAVYAAYDPASDRRVALKFWHTRPSVTRHLQDAKTMAEVSHPNVIPIYETGVLNGRVFLAMEFVAGGTLRDWQAKEPRAWNETLAMYLQAGRGLAAAHASNVVHKDFKPENVLIGDDKKPRVTDFALAQREITNALPTADKNGMVPYMAPEQREGFISPASDQFSFCVALYGALYGLHPFPVGEHVVRQPPRTKQVPAWVLEPLVRGMSTSPMERYPSMDVLLDVLSQPIKKKVPWRRAVWAVPAVALLALVSLVSFRAHSRPAPAPVASAAPLEHFEPSAEAAALLEQGRVEQENGHPDMAVEKFYAAIAVAEKARDDRARAKAWVELAGLEDPKRTGAVARAILDRASAGDDLHATLEDRLSGAFLRQGDLSAALDHAQEAVDLRRDDATSLHLAESLEQLASVQRRLSRFDDALTANGRAQAILEKALGAEDPAVGRVLVQRAALLTELRRFGDAIPVAQRALDLAEKEKPTSPKHVAAAELVTGRALAADAQYEPAILHLENAVSLSEAAYGKTHAETGAAYAALARSLWDGKADRKRARLLARAARPLVHHDILPK
jgi:tetratricopeptide (TPR) repeat protein